jgi:hypothetical protein
MLCKSLRDLAFYVFIEQGTFFETKLHGLDDRLEEFCNIIV